MTSLLTGHLPVKIARAGKCATYIWTFPALDFASVALFPSWLLRLRRRIDFFKCLLSIGIFRIQL